jgi:hypothetical protein
MLGRHDGILAAADLELDDSAEDVENLGVVHAVPGWAGPLESRIRSDHARPVENASALSARRDMFLDERGTGLRVTWHPERDLVVLSVWQDDRCVGTFRMSVQDVPRLSGLLAAALGDWVDQAGPDPGAARDPGAGRDLGTAGLGLGAPGGAGDPGSSGPGAGAPGAGRDAGAVRRWAGTGGVGLSVQRRIRLSRPVLKLRGIQHRRRRSG